MSISEEDKKEHDEWVNNLTEEQMQELTTRTVAMLEDWADKEEVGSVDHKFLADLAVPVGVYVLFSGEDVEGSVLSLLVMSTAFAAFNYGRSVEREAFAQTFSGEGTDD